MSAPNPTKVELVQGELRERYADQLAQLFGPAAVNTLIELVAVPRQEDFDAIHTTPTIAQLWARRAELQRALELFHDHGFDAPLFVYDEIELRTDQIRNLEHEIYGHDPATPCG